MPLTGIRAIAAGWVFAYHYRNAFFAFFAGLRVFEPLLKCGFLGVDLFFALSGFVLTYNYHDRFGQLTSSGYFDFCKQRIARIYPVHIVTLLVAALMYFGAPRLHFHINHPNDVLNNGETFLRNVLLLQAWGAEKLSFNAASWSISAEWFAYLIFPILTWFLSRQKLSWPVALAGTVLTYLGLALVWTWVGPGGAMHGALVRIGFEFLGGVFLFHLWNANPKFKFASLILYPSLLLAVVLPWTNLFQWNDAIRMAFVFGFMVLGLAYGSDPISRILSKRLFIIGGEISYSMYMVHELIHPILNRVLDPDRAGHSGIALRFFAMLVYLIVPWLFAYLTYRWIEVPGRHLVRGKKTVRHRPLDTLTVEGVQD